MNESICSGRITPDQLALLGMDDLAYVKPVILDGRAAVSIHAADGRPIGLMSCRDVAFAALRQQGFEPLSLH